MRLTDSQVKQMKTDFMAGVRPVELAQTYQVSLATIYKYLRGRSRKSCGEEDLLQPMTDFERMLDIDPGKLIKGIRGLVDITQAEFARLMGKSGSTIGNWETGVARMKLTDRRKLVGWIVDQGIEEEVRKLVGSGTVGYE